MQHRVFIRPAYSVLRDYWWLHPFPRSDAPAPHLHSHFNTEAISRATSPQSFREAVTSRECAAHEFAVHLHHVVGVTRFLVEIRLALTQAPRYRIRFTADLSSKFLTQNVVLP
jgi:hypothetical protein